MFFLLSLYNVLVCCVALMSKEMLTFFCFFVYVFCIFVQEENRKKILDEKRVFVDVELLFLSKKEYNVSSTFVQGKNTHRKDKT